MGWSTILDIYDIKITLENIYLEHVPEIRIWDNLAHVDHWDNGTEIVRRRAVIVRFPTILVIAAMFLNINKYCN